MLRLSRDKTFPKKQTINHNGITLCSLFRYVTLTISARHWYAYVVKFSEINVCKVVLV